jgi:transcriptional regulator with XRE-family HTH domain
MKIANSKSRIIELLTISEETQADMARKSGLSRNSISRYVRGIQIPNQEAIDKIAKAYHVSPAWLMGYSVDMYQNTDKELTDKFEVLNENDKQFVLGIINYLIKRG